MNSTNQAQVLCHFKCDDHLKNISNLFNSLHSTDSLVDLTISCQGGSFRAHKFVLSACSPYFKRILNENPCKHPTFIMHGILFEDMKLLLEFMYKGAVSVPEDSINSLVEIATNLEIKGFRFDRDLTSKPADDFVLKCKPDGPAAVASSAAVSADDRPKSKKKCTYGIRADVKIKQNDQDEYVEVEEVDSGIDTEKNKVLPGSNGTNSGRQTRFRGLKRVPVGEVVYSDDYYPDSGRNSVQRRQLAATTAVSNKVADDCFSNIVIKDIRGANGSLCLSVASKNNDTVQTENILDPDVMSLIPDITISEQVHHKPEEINDIKKEHIIKSEYLTNDKVNEDNHTDHKDNLTFPQKSVDAKPFRCEFCKLGFTRSSHLLRHRRTHTGERPFACKNCDKAFSRQDKLRIHMMRTHEDVFKPKFVCEYCDKVFERQESLKAHLTKHDYEYVPNKYKVPVNLHSSIGIDEQSNIQSGSQSITQSIIQTVKEYTTTSSSNATLVTTPPDIPTTLSNSASKLLKRKRGRPRTREIPVNKEKRRRGRPRKLSVEGEYSNQDNYDLMSLPFGDFSYLTSELPIQLPNSSVGVTEVIETTPTLPVLSPTPEPVVVPVDVPEQQQEEEPIQQQQEQQTEDNDSPPQSSANELINSIRVIGECTISPLN